MMDNASKCLYLFVTAAEDVKAVKDISICNGRKAKSE